MHLYQLRLADYRRFVDATINLDSKMVAILGPNESGKSSLLDALALFNNENRVPEAALRKGTDKRNERVVGELTYRLSSNERALVPYRLPKFDALWLKATKHVGGALDFELIPSPSRPLSARQSASSALQAALNTRWYDELDATEEDAEDDLPQLVANLADATDNNLERLSDETIEQLGIAARRLSELNNDAYSVSSKTTIASLAKKLIAAREVELHPTPRELAQRVAERRPQCLPFDDAHRTLAFSHNLTKLADVSAAFRNLADFGDLDLSALRTAISQDFSGDKLTLVDNARERINRRLKEDWGQSNLKVGFDLVSVEDVRITVAGKDGRQFDLTDRSDGMRMVLALCAFLAKEGQDPKPVLLVDELERHLHYEAQADIVSMFDRRTDVAQIVYTTHSIGCLPQDLGRGVRVVVPDTDGGTSDINNLWLRNQVGVQPLMAAMGAATLPLQPSRPLVYGEGECDALLLPSLLREAIGGKPLGYLVVNGASKVSKANVEQFEDSARRVAYLYDGDQAARDRLRFYRRNTDVPEDRVVFLELGVTLEDLIEPSLWVDACNRAITDLAAGYYPVLDVLGVDDISERDRAEALTAWCQKRGYTRIPEKLAIAETIIELMTGPNPRADRRWLDPRRKAGLRPVHDRIVAKFPKQKQK
jgi:predicted ATP-dependent endonuclease of OLD family